MSTIKPNERYCPLYGRTHRFSDWSSWGVPRPKCDCGYEDQTRVIINGKKVPINEN